MLGVSNVKVLKGHAMVPKLLRCCSVSADASMAVGRLLRASCLSATILAALFFTCPTSTRAAILSSGDDRVANGRIGIDFLGYLTVNGGSTQNNTDGLVGVNPGSHGSATVTGAGSLWSNTDFVMVGNYGTGQLVISDDGPVHNTDGYIGYSGSSSGTVTVSGPGSLWHNSQFLDIAGSAGTAGGTGVLEVDSGGTVNVAPDDPDLARRGAESGRRLRQRGRP